MAVGHEAKATTHRAWTRIASTDTSGDVEWVTIYAAETGPAGADITITVASGGSTVVTDDLITRTVAIVFATSDNSADIAAVINASSALVRAKGQDTELWLGTTTPTATLKLGHFGTLRHPACAESHDMLRGGDGGIGAGIRRLELSTDWMCDAASVRAALWWRASAFALPHRRVTVTAPDTYAALDRPGSPVVVHHPELGLYDTVGLVEAYEHDLHAGRVAVQVLIIDRPGRQWGQS
jgi:hypothetical protein